MIDPLMIDPLAEAAPSFRPEAAGQLLSDLYGLEGSLTVLYGERDLNFRIDAAGQKAYLLKIYNPADSAEVVDMRSQALAHIERTDPDLPICRIIPARDGSLATPAVAPDGRESQAQLFTFLEGRHPSRQELTGEALFDWGRWTARLGRALQGYFHPAARYPIQWDVRRAGDLGDRLVFVHNEHRPLVAQVIDSFTQEVAPVLPRLRAQVIHNDMNRENVLVDGTGKVIGITDFGDMTHTTLVCDLAVAIADVLDGRPDSLPMAELMIAGYGSLTPLDPEEAGVLGGLVAARLATAIVLSAWRQAQGLGRPGSPNGAVSFLQILAKEGLAEVASRFQHAARSTSARACLPYHPRTRPDLATARPKVLGPLGLFYDEPLHLVRGEGVHVYDSEGRRYIDAYNNVPVVGHCHPDVVAAIEAQAGLLVTNTRYLHEASVQLGEELLATAPGHLDRVLLVNSGSEANDMAWRIACFATGGQGALVSRHAYHGVTQATADLSPEEWPAGYTPGHVGLVAPPPSDASSALSSIRYLEASGHLPAALFVDPAFTSDGIQGPASDWLQSAARAVRQAGGLVVADEVQAGYGRTGEGLWSIVPSGLDPDLMTLGKPMGNGFPVAAVLGSSELIDPFIEETGYFSTFGGNTLACAAALAVLHVLQAERLVERAAEVGALLRHRLNDVASRHEAVGAVRSWGLLCGLELVGPEGAADRQRAAAVANHTRRLGVLVGTTGPAGNILKIRPPLVFQAADADELADRLDQALGSA
jgi:4-aminobutyrate aminotransferase-like enzyme/Ser/Thr protein kinase RdoA (MazF antagonist)